MDFIIRALFVTRKAEVHLRDIFSIHSTTPPFGKYSLCRSDLMVVASIGKRSSIGALIHRSYPRLDGPQMMRSSWLTEFSCYGLS